MIADHKNDSSKETKQDILENKLKKLQNKDEGKVSDNANCTEKFLPEVMKPFFRPVRNKIKLLDFQIAFCKRFIDACIILPSNFIKKTFFYKTYRYVPVCNSLHVCFLPFRPNI